MQIWILEDNADRIVVMKKCLQKWFGIQTTHVFETARKFNEAIRDQVHAVDLISLDHDLEDVLLADGTKIDPGTGRDVADFLATQTPTCPIIIHSTNVPAGIGMEMELKTVGWKTIRITPYDDTNWITEIWIETASKILSDKPCEKIADQ